MGTDGVSVMSCTQSHTILISHAVTSYTITVTLSSQNTGWTALMFAVDEGRKDMVQRLVSAGADVHIRDKVCGDMESVRQMLHVASSKWVRENRLYSSTCI